MLCSCSISSDKKETFLNGSRFYQLYIPSQVMAVHTQFPQAQTQRLHSTWVSAPSSYVSSSRAHSRKRAKKGIGFEWAQWIGFGMSPNRVPNAIWNPHLSLTCYCSLNVSAVDFHHDGGRSFWPYLGSSLETGRLVTLSSGILNLSIHKGSVPWPRHRHRVLQKWVCGPDPKLPPKLWSHWEMFLRSTNAMHDLCRPQKHPKSKTQKWHFGTSGDTSKAHRDCTWPLWASQNLLDPIG